MWVVLRRRQAQASADRHPGYGNRPELTASLLSPGEYAREDVWPTGLLWAKAQP